MAALIIFHGPNTESQIKAYNANGFEVARFMISGSRKEWSLSRLTSPNTPPVPIATATYGSMSGKTKIQVHGVEMKLREEYETILETPMGKMKWKLDSSFSSRNMTLKDENKVVIAKATTKDELRCEILVPGDERFLDFMLAGYVALIFAVRKGREVNSAVFEGVGALAGAGGGS
jgi:hypothetical protein